MDPSTIPGHDIALPPVRIACVHQGYELYGSDRSFIDSVKALRNAFPAAHMTVILPRNGPIVDCLSEVATEIRIEPLWVLRRKALAVLATFGLIRLAPAVARAVATFRAHDLVYINTCVITDYLLAARLFRSKAVLHIHEIPEGAVRRVLNALVRWSGAEIIFNSRATRSAFSIAAGMPTHVIYNGVAGPRSPEPTTYDATRLLRVLMLGRINRVKGQEVLLQALALLPEATRSRVAVRMVGSAFESDERERALLDLIRTLGLSEQVVAEPFLADPSDLYRWADIVAVPSRLPESLGRVAIEAMAFGRPVVASAIGGLAEVVEDRRTGWLVPPNDGAALAATLCDVIENPGAWRDFGAAGRARYETLFAEAIAADAIADLVRTKLSGSVPARGRHHPLHPTAGLP